MVKVPKALRPERERMAAREVRPCAFKLDGDKAVFDCGECPNCEDAPTARCLPGIVRAIERHPDLAGVVLRGDTDTWIRGDGLTALTSKVSEGRAWRSFCSQMRSLPCQDPVPRSRVEDYLRGCDGIDVPRLCEGRGGMCEDCLGVQDRAIADLASGRRKARRSMAMGRFRITDVPGGTPE